MSLCFREALELLLLSLVTDSEIFRGLILVDEQPGPGGLIQLIIMVKLRLFCMLLHLAAVLIC